MRWNGQWGWERFSRPWFLNVHFASLSTSALELHATLYPFSYPLPYLTLSTFPSTLLFYSPPPPPPPTHTHTHTYTPLYIPLVLTIHFCLLPFASCRLALLWSYWIYPGGGRITYTEQSPTELPASPGAEISWNWSHCRYSGPTLHVINSMYDLYTLMYRWTPVSSLRLFSS